MNVGFPKKYLPIGDERLRQLRAETGAFRHILSSDAQRLLARLDQAEAERDYLRREAGLPTAISELLELLSRQGDGAVLLAQLLVAAREEEWPVEQALRRVLRWRSSQRLVPGALPWTPAPTPSASGEAPVAADRPKQP